mmetsp:Transcript_38710/g.124415  ORF Transcript_38710/g.124415 Transcript_38710/m.124415 type:complete len:450 (+) Transcript_38710:3207-4556(+)
MSGLDAVFVWHLLRTCELVDVRAHAAVGILFGLYRQVFFIGARAMPDAEQDDVHNADDVLVLACVEHEPSLALLDLGNELVEGLGLAFAKVFGDYAVVGKHLLDVFRASFDHRVEFLSIQVPYLRVIDEFRLRALGLAPPLEIVGLLGMFVVHLETSRDVLVGHAQISLWVDVFFGLRVLKALHELTTALTDAGIGTSFLDLRHEILVEGLQRLCRRLDGSEEGVVDGSPGRKARLLVPFEGSLQETLAVLATPVRDLHLLNPDVFLPLEREATCHHAENDDSETPNVNFQAVVQLVELRTPVRLRATFRLQTFAFGQVNHSAEIAEVDAATRVFEIHPILQVVVALQIAMHHVALVKPVHTLEHHLAHVLDDRNGDHALRLPMELHAFNHVATPVNLEHHAHEDLLVVDIVQLHDARVRQLLQHVDLLPDLNQRGLHLVNHLHGKLLI